MRFPRFWKLLGASGYRSSQPSSESETNKICNDSDSETSEQLALVNIGNHLGGTVQNVLDDAEAFQVIAGDGARHLVTSISSVCHQLYMHVASMRTYDIVESQRAYNWACAPELKQQLYRIDKLQKETGSKLKHTNEPVPEDTELHEIQLAERFTTVYEVYITLSDIWQTLCKISRTLSAAIRIGYSQTWVPQPILGEYGTTTKFMYDTCWTAVHAFIYGRKSQPEVRDLLIQVWQLGMWGGRQFKEVTTGPLSLDELFGLSKTHARTLRPSLVRIFGQILVFAEWSIEERMDNIRSGKEHYSDEDKKKDVLSKLSVWKAETTSLLNTREFLGLASMLWSSRLLDIERARDAEALGEKSYRQQLLDDESVPDEDVPEMIEYWHKIRSYKGPRLETLVTMVDLLYDLANTFLIVRHSCRNLRETNRGASSRLLRSDVAEALQRDLSTLQEYPISSFLAEFGEVLQMHAKRSMPSALDLRKLVKVCEKREKSLKQFLSNMEKDDPAVHEPHLVERSVRRERLLLCLILAFNRCTTDMDSEDTVLEGRLPTDAKIVKKTRDGAKQQSNQVSRADEILRYLREELEVLTTVKA